MSVWQARLQSLESGVTRTFELNFFGSIVSAFLRPLCVFTDSLDHDNWQ
jgi:hypothetical protein